MTRLIDGELVNVLINKHFSISILLLCVILCLNGHSRVVAYSTVIIIEGQMPSTLTHAMTHSTTRNSRLCAKQVHNRNREENDLSY